MAVICLYATAVLTNIKAKMIGEFTLARFGPTEFKTLLGLDTLLVGFGLNSDAIHSPNEHFGLDRFELGIEAHETLLRRFAAVK